MVVGGDKRWASVQGIAYQGYAGGSLLGTYMKGSLQFEGTPKGSDGYSSGFGVIAEPHIDITDLTGGWRGRQMLLRVLSRARVWELYCEV